MDLIKADGKPLSTFQIARVLCRERVIAVPTLWTNLHLDLLECSFGRVTYDQFAEKEEGPATLLLVFASFAYFNTWRRSHSVAKLICKDKDIYLDDKVCLFFEGKIAEVLPCTTFHVQPVANHARSPPFAAYADLERLQRIRERYFEPMQGASLCDIKLKKATPEVPMQDPYIAAILIAMAQEQQASAFEVYPGPYVMQMTVWRPPMAVTQNVADKSKFRPKLVVTKPDSFCVYLYRTNINSTFLCKFSDPGVQPPHATSMEIQISAIPLKPLCTLGRRLLELVLPE
ncbi:unnamed protein product [Clonostachys solani]|uniref:Uncharacterized protein n=1 Tax=Clonostachys solani TaxID=160281 RepID=A0A9P0EEX6_9HYPO|nr:unnamed protein product [Clonostachys solani]